MVEGKLVLDSPDEMDLVFDVAVFDTRSGQSRALDRYARAHPAAPGSDEALTLDALQHSRFHIVRVLRRHEVAGLVTEDTVTHEQLWLMDEGFNDRQEWDGTGNPAPARQWILHDDRLLSRSQPTF